jgi:hypothetical protein
MTIHQKVYLIFPIYFISFSYLSFVVSLGIVSLRKRSSSCHENDKHCSDHRHLLSLITLAHLRLRALDYSRQPTPFESLFPRAPVLPMRGGPLLLRLRNLPRLRPQAAEPHLRSAGRGATSALGLTEVLLGQRRDLNQAPSRVGLRRPPQRCWWLYRQRREDQDMSAVRRVRGLGTRPSGAGAGRDQVFERLSVKIVRWRSEL